MLERAAKYLPLILLVLVLIVLSVILIPQDRLAGYQRASVFAFLFGALVGASEIASRYRDEPLRALWSPFGVIYIVLNGYLSFLSVLLILRYRDRFPTIANDQLLVAITAGFGATAVMRTRLAVIKGADNKEISVGPDSVITSMLQLVDKNIDRHRAARRQAIVVARLDQIRTMGDFTTAAKYLFASLLAFQNLDEALKAQLNAIFNDYERQTLPVDIKYLALGFVFLTIVGEAHYESVLKNAIQIRISAPQPPPSPPAPPVQPAQPPRGGNPP